MKKIIIATSLIAPALASAQLTRTGILIIQFKYLLGIVSNTVFALGLLAFFWGLVRYIFKIGGDTKAAEEGRKLMIWGTLAIFVMVSIWGLVRLLQGELLPGIGYENVEIPAFNSKF